MMHTVIKVMEDLSRMMAAEDLIRRCLPARLLAFIARKERKRFGCDDFFTRSVRSVKTLISR